MMEIDACVPYEEAEALERAMARSERDVPGDERTTDQRNCDRFMTVAERVLEVSHAAFEGWAKGAA